MILEDDDNIRKLTSYSLTSQSFEIKDFALPSDFWTTLENNKPDLLLLDIMHPQEDDISVIMLTAKDSEYDVVTALDAEADDYVTKPFGMLPFVSHIKTVFCGNQQLFLTVKEFDTSLYKKQITNL